MGIRLAALTSVFTLAVLASPLKTHAQTPLGSQPAQTSPRRRFYLLYEAIANERVAEVRRRLPPASQINDIDRGSGATPLTWLLTGTHAPTAATAELLELLLRHGANPNTRDAAGWTPMQLAVQYPWPHALRRLIAHNGNLQLTEASRGVSLLYSLCHNDDSRWPSQHDDRIEIAHMLLHAGLDPRVMSPWAVTHQFTSVDQCVVQRFPEIARLYGARGGRARTTLASRAPQSAALARELSEGTLGPMVTPASPPRALEAPPATAPAIVQPQTPQTAQPPTGWRRVSP
ncbi:MAG: hypothetical protein Q8Q09_24300 [Deltaproteobacteria bacterium]|nr:hypothetical protein [Deltaproteobacteria bacterium]